MSRNRVPGDSYTPLVTTAVAGTTLNDDVNTDLIVLNSGLAAGTPAITVKLNGVLTTGVAPADGDQIVIADPFNVLAAGTTLVVDGNGKRIADGGALANTKTYNTAGSTRTFTFVLALDGGAGAWVRSGS